jgi:hypothetical protein
MSSSASLVGGLRPKTCFTSSSTPDEAIARLRLYETH